MKSRTYTLEELLDQRRRWSVVSSYDIITKYLEEAAKSKDLLTNMIKQFEMHFPLLLQGIVFGSKLCVFPISELFVKEMCAYPNKNMHKYGSTDLSSFINIFKKNLARGYFTSEKQREKFLYQAINALSSEDYLALRYLLEQKIPIEVAGAIEKIISEPFKKQFMGSYVLTPKHIDMFKNSAQENIYVTNKIDYYVAIPEFNNIVIKIEQNKKSFVDNEDAKLLNKYVVEKKTDATFFLHDGKKFFGEVKNNSVTLYESERQVNEAEFDTEILSGSQYIFAKTNLIFDASRTDKEIIKAKSFEVKKNDSFYSNVCMLKLFTDNKEYEVRMLNSESEIGKATKNFNVLKYDNKYYFMRKQL